MTKINGLSKKGISSKEEKAILKDMALEEGLCKCGHKQTDHRNTEFEEGHGACNSCDCSKFTWAEFISAPTQIKEGGENGL